MCNGATPNLLCHLAFQTKIQKGRYEFVPAFSFGGGGGIRTPDLWVMSPTSYRCSTPRHAHIRLYPFFRTDVRPIGGARSGLASRGATPQYSPALRWVTTGFGMGPGGATALWATSPPDRWDGWVRIWVGRWGRSVLPGGNKAVLGGGLGGTGGWRPSSAMSTTRLRSITRRPPVASQPGHLPGALLVLSMGILVLRRGSHLDAFSGSPVRT